jgi:hypothetical protein
MHLSHRTHIHLILSLLPRSLHVIPRSLRIAVPSSQAPAHLHMSTQWRCNCQPLTHSHLLPLSIASLMTTQWMMYTGASKTIKCNTCTNQHMHTQHTQRMQLHLLLLLLLLTPPQAGFCRAPMPTCLNLPLLHKATAGRNASCCLRCSSPRSCLRPLRIQTRRSSLRVARLSTPPCLMT